MGKGEEEDLHERAERIRNDPKAMEQVLQWNLAKAHAARTSLPDFFEYVMREEFSGEPMRLAPHQRVVLDFIQHHERAVIMMPPSHSKTFLMTAVALHLLGVDPTSRGAIVSAAQEQAERPLGSIRKYIESSAELKVVFPRLRPSLNPGDPWTQTKLTIDRPGAIRDASMRALGINGSILGSRLKWILIDDILDEQNTHTKEARDQVYQWVQTEVITRLDLKGGRIVICNTAFHPEDLPHRLRDQLRWPTLRMSASGNVHVEGDVKPRWAVNDAISRELRPRSSSPYEVASRLTAHDPDPHNLQTLWPEKLDRAGIEFIKQYQLLPLAFERMYEQNCRDDATALCKQEYIDRCKEVAQRESIFALADSWAGAADDTAFTGVDLSTGEGNDETALFTFFVRPKDKLRIILEIEHGMWPAPEIVDRIYETHKRFNSIVRVEDNGTQKHIRQMLLARDQSIPINDHHTTATKKKDPNYGIQRIFVEMRNGAWALPTDRHNRCPAPVQKFIDACLHYRPSKHTPDVLMAAHFAMAQAHEWGLLTPANTDAQNQVNAVGAGFMAR